MTVRKNMLKSVGKAFIPQYVPNFIVLGMMSLLSTLYKISRKQVQQNRVHNTQVLAEQGDLPERERFFTPGAYIENQRHWDKVHFGSGYTMAYGGCEIMSVYNALLSLGKELSGGEMAELIGWFERKGAVLAGKLGAAPKAAYRYFCEQEYVVCMLSRRDEAAINTLGEQSDTTIVTVYNDGRDIFRRVHTVNISKDAEGHYFVHNGYKAGRNERGGVEYISDGPYDTLWEAICSMSEGKAVPVCVIGIENTCVR